MFGQVNLHSSLVDEQLSRDGGVIASRLSFAQPSERVYPGALQPQLLWIGFLGQEMTSVPGRRLSCGIN
jgi:hypothetical protein